MQRDARIHRIFLDLHMAGAVKRRSEESYPAGPQKLLHMEGLTGQGCRGPALHEWND